MVINWELATIMHCSDSYKNLDHCQIWKNGHIVWIIIIWIFTTYGPLHCFPYIFQ